MVPLVTNATYKFTIQQEMNSKLYDSVDAPSNSSELEKDLNFLESSFVSGIRENDSPSVSSGHFTSTPSILRKKCIDFKLPEDSCALSMDDSGFDDGSLSSERNSPDSFPKNLATNHHFKDLVNDDDDEDEGFADVSSTSTGFYGNYDTKVEESRQPPRSDAPSSGTSQRSTSGGAASEPTTDDNEFFYARLLQETDRVDGGSTSKNAPDPLVDLSRAFSAKLSLGNLNAASVAFAWRKEFSVARKFITVTEYNDRLLAVLKHFAPANVCRLIGRKMGLEQVDIVAELLFRNILCVLQTILNYLGDQDLFRMTAVSAQWRTAVESIASARLKRPRHKHRNRSTEKTDENGNARKMTGHSSPSSLTLDPLNVKLHRELTAGSAITVPDRMQQFWEEASKLRNHESLRMCPRCRHPSRFDAVQERARCQNARCSFDFCVRCFLQFHSSWECGTGTMYNRAVHKENKVGSKQSRKNLRRLL